MANDWAAAIAEIEARVGHDTARRLARIYLEEGTRQRAAIAAALAGGELEAVRREAHDLVTNAGSLGFTKLGDLAFALERAAVSHDSPSALTAWVKIGPLIADSMMLLRARYDLP
jgi:HPt (histidine-containing phosphotransfer) domain-containing protein